VRELGSSLFLYSSRLDGDGGPACSTITMAAISASRRPFSLVQMALLAG